MVLAISGKYVGISPFFMTNVVPSLIEHESKFVIILTALHQFQISASLNMFSNELGHSMKPKNNTWFLKFLLIEIDKDMSVDFFCMNKVN
jgi:hypothetical protein